MSLPKPSLYGFQKRNIAPEWQWFWDSCVFALPLWEASGEVVKEYVYDEEGTIEIVDGNINWQKADFTGETELHWDQNPVSTFQGRGINFGRHASRHAINDNGRVSIVSGLVPDIDPDGGGGGRIISHGFDSSGDSWAIFLEDDRRIIFRVNNNDHYETSANLVADEHAQITCTYKPTGAATGPHIYINNVESTNTAQSIRNDSFDAAPYAEDLDVCVGRNGSTDDRRYIQGSLRYVYVFRDELNHDQRQQLLEDPYGPFRMRQVYVPIQEATGATLSGNSVTQGAASSSGAVSQSHELAGNDVTAGALSSTGAVSQSHELAANDATTGATSTAGAVSQTHELAANDVTAGTLSSTGAVSQSQELSGKDVTQGATSSTGAIGQEGELIGAPSNQAALSSTGSITQTHILIAEGVTGSLLGSTGSIFLATSAPSRVAGFADSRNYATPVDSLRLATLSRDGRTYAVILKE